jgi:hypothetical protein
VIADVRHRGVPGRRTHRPGLLESHTQGQLRADRVRALVRASEHDARLDESVLSLMVLATSLGQLGELR